MLQIRNAVHEEKLMECTQTQGALAPIASLY